MAEQETNVIVAIPREGDYVWNVSSEKIPHMTLLYLEDLTTDPDLESILQFVQHAANTSLDRFGLSVDHRGELGDNSADVLFFEKGLATKTIDDFRQALLRNDKIKQAYLAVPQFPEWQPHLTLGYPDAPAKPDPREYPSFSYVAFDRIAIWTSDYSGPTFELNDPYAQEVVMSDHASAILAHHGVKGMKWGQRKDRATGSIRTAATDAKERIDKEVKERTGSDTVVRTKPGAGVRVVGGNNRNAHEDAVNARVSEQVAKKSSLDALSNKDLQNLVTRMNLEQQYRNLAANEDRRSAGEKFADNVLSTKGDLLPAKLQPAYPALKTALEQSRKLGNKAAASGSVQSKKNK